MHGKDLLEPIFLSRNAGWRSFRHRTEDFGGIEWRPGFQHLLAGGERVRRWLASISQVFEGRSAVARDGMKGGWRPGRAPVTSRIDERERNDTNSMGILHLDRACARPIRVTVCRAHLELGRSPNAPGTAGCEEGRRAELSGLRVEVRFDEQVL